MSAKHKARGGGAQARSPSLWDLLDLNLQRYIIQLALESRKSEVRERYLSISSTYNQSGLEDFDEDNVVSLARLAKRQLVWKLKRVVLKIHDDERRLLGLDAHRNDEMLELHDSLQNLIDPIGLGF